MERARGRRIARPPYAPVQGMREFFDKVTLKAQPARVDTEYLKELGVAPGNELHVLAALRFLDLVGGDGRPTQHFRILNYRGAERKKELQRLLRHAYRDLFSGELDLRAATREDVHTHFVRQYGLQGQMARKATAVFTFLSSTRGSTTGIREGAPRGRWHHRPQGGADASGNGLGPLSARAGSAP